MRPHWQALIFGCILALSCAPVWTAPVTQEAPAEVEVDPEGLLPDVDRGNNRWEGRTP